MTLQCCKGCGRDTRNPHGYCERCVGHADYCSDRRDDFSNYGFEHEDRYDEESGPDDVCDYD